MVTSETYAPAALTEIYCDLETNYKTWWIEEPLDLYEDKKTKKMEQLDVYY